MNRLTLVAVWLVAMRSGQPWEMRCGHNRGMQAEAAMQSSGSSHVCGTSATPLHGKMTDRPSDADDGQAKRTVPCVLERASESKEYKETDPRFSVAVTVPQFSAKTPFCEAINADLVQWRKQEFTSVSSEFLQNTRDPDHGPLPYEHQTSISVLYADGSMISLLYETYRYTGGAHGNHEFTSKTWLWRDNKLVELRPDELVDKNSTAQLAGLIARDLKRQRAAWAENAKSLDLGKAVVNPCVGGLMFTFAPYEVDCYAAGTFYVVLPWKALQGTVPASSPLSRLVPQNPK